jgi:hypothetical protein
MRSLRLAVPHLVFPTLLAAQSATPSSGFDVSLRNIMRGPELYGRTRSTIKQVSGDGAAR